MTPVSLTAAFQSLYFQRRDLYPSALSDTVTVWPNGDQISVDSIDPHIPKRQLSVSIASSPVRSTIGNTTKAVNH